MATKKYGASLEPITIKRIKQLAEETRRTQGAVIDIAIERLSQSRELQDEFTPIVRKPRAAQTSEASA